MWRKLGRQSRSKASGGLPTPSANACNLRRKLDRQSLPYDRKTANCIHPIGASAQKNGHAMNAQGFYRTRKLRYQGIQFVRMSPECEEMHQISEIVTRL